MEDMLKSFFCVSEKYKADTDSSGVEKRRRKKRHNLCENMPKTLKFFLLCTRKIPGRHGLFWC